MRNVRIGKVRLKELAPKADGTRRFQACWLDRSTYKYVRKTLPFAKISEARAEAERINRELLAADGFASPSRYAKEDGHSVREAALEAIQRCDGNQETKEDYVYRFARFADFLRRKMPRVTLWSQVDEKVLADYIHECWAEGKAYDTVRQRFQILRLTSGHMARTYPERHRNAAQNVRLGRNGHRRSRLAADDILTGGQLRGLLAWLGEKEPMLHAWASLQGLCGLRVTEAIYVREQDFDPVAKTVMIADTSAHALKNDWSERRLPVCDAVAGALGRWIEKLDPRHPEGYLFFPPRTAHQRKIAKRPSGKAGCYSVWSAGRKYRRALARAKRDGLDLAPRFTPHRLRATFSTAMREAHADAGDLQTYMGQRPSSILGLHYDRVSPERLAEIARLSQGLAEG